MKRVISRNNDGTWDVLVDSMSEALLDCDLKLGNYGDETKEFTRIKTKRRYEITLVVSEQRGEKHSTRSVYLMSVIEPYIVGEFIFYRLKDDPSHSVTGFPLRDVTSITASALIVPIERQLVKTVNPMLLINKDDIHYVYREGDLILDDKWRLNDGCVL